MKKIFLIPLLIISILPAGAGRAQEEADFRGVKWGVSRKEVKEQEASSRLVGEMPDLLVYQGEIAGIPASIFYLFDGNKLVRGIYSIENDRQNAIIKDYETIRSFLLKRYGEPTAVKTEPEGESPTGDLNPAQPEYLYSLILQGSARPEITWKQDSTRVCLRLVKKDNRVELMVDYINIPAEKL